MDHKETWLDAFMFCMSNDMELLRIESKDELMAFERALKYNWIYFGDALFVDGIKKSDETWYFMGNDAEVDGRIYDMAKHADDASELDNCMMIAKNLSKLTFKASMCSVTRKKFVCQRKVQQREAAETGPLKVQVQSRMFEEVGSFTESFNGKSTTSTFYLNRYYYLSTASAANFCRSFNMNLVTIGSAEKLAALRMNIMKNRYRLEQHFAIGGSRLKALVSQPWFKPTLLKNEWKRGNCLAVSTFDSEDQIYYFDCETDQQGFICEKLQTSQKFRNNNATQEVLNVKKTIGLQLKRTSEKMKLTYYISDARNVSFFNAYSYCKMMGMDLYSPANLIDLSQFASTLEKNSSTIAIGITRIGTEGFWYATKTGTAFNHKVEPSSSEYKCLQLKSVEKDVELVYELNDYDCADKSERFICESTSK